MKKIADVLENVKTLGIAGHIRPDGDCVGSCMGLYLYLKTWYPEIQAEVYLDHPGEAFYHIQGMEEILMTSPAPDKTYDVFITLDVSAKDRLALAKDAYDRAGKRICIDHHVSNPGFGDINYIQSQTSSASEVLYPRVEPEKVTRPGAEAM